MYHTIGVIHRHQFAHISLHFFNPPARKTIGTYIIKQRNDFFLENIIYGGRFNSILVTSYSAAVLKSIKRALVVGAMVILLYVYLYTLLTIQDYALLVGTIGLFVVLAITMFLTRRVDWYSLANNIVATSPEEREQE